MHMYTYIDISMEHDLHSSMSFVDDGLLAKVEFTVTSYYAKRFEELRKICYLSELDFIWSVSGCKKSVAQGGKGNLFSTESLDDRLLVKQVTNTELESFIEFAPAYFEHLTGALLSQCPTCLQKIMGIYQVNTKQLKEREESKWDIVVMENLWLDHWNVTRVYDLKDCCGSDSSEGNKVLSDQDLVGTMTIPPIFVRRKSLMLLERAIWNDTAFLAWRKKSRSSLSESLVI